MLYFVLLLPSKKDCINTKNKIEIFLKNTLKLELNDKSRYYPYKMGVNFCGYRIFTTHKLLRLSSKKKIKKNIKRWNLLYKNNNLNLFLTMQQLNSWLGHARHCNSYKLQQKVINNCSFLYSNYSLSCIEQQLISDIENNNTTWLEEQ